MAASAEIDKHVALAINIAVHLYIQMLHVRVCIERSTLYHAVRFQGRRLEYSPESAATFQGRR